MVSRTRRQPSDQVRVVIYSRVSSTSQEENTSLTTQVAGCRSLASTRRWLVVHEEQEVHTGADLHGRPGLRRVRDLAREGRVDVILCYALDRLSRKQAHLAIVADECAQAGVRLEFVTEEFENSAVGEFIRAAKAFAAEIEREKIIERTVRGKRARAESGRPIPGRKAPYGYVWADPVAKDRLAEHPVEGAVVRRIFSEVVAGKSLRAIAAGLADDGHPSPTGNAHWARTTLHVMLRLPTYSGEMRAYRQRGYRRYDPEPRGRYRPEAEHIALPAGVAPALIAPDLQAAAIERLERNKTLSPRRNRDPEATLLRGGLVRCGVCGNALIAVRRRANYWDYHCTNRDKGFEHRRPCISAGMLDDAVWQRIEDVLTKPEVIKAQVERLHDTDPHALELNGLDRQLESLKAKRTRIARAIAALDDEDANAPLLVELKTLASQVKAIGEEHARLAALAQSWETGRDLLTELATWSDRVKVNLPDLTYEERRNVLAALGAQVRVLPAPELPRWELTLRWQDLLGTTVSSSSGYTARVSP